MKQLYPFILLLLLSVSIYAQGEANNWYFGNNAGITFNTNPPSALLNGEINTLEGCSSISDVGGNLLLYTDGQTVWDRTHTIMSNADYFGGTGLMGDPSSTQSGLIVPHPTESNLFYIFTVDEPHHNNAFAYPNQGPANPDGSPRTNYEDVPSHTVPQDDDGFNNGFNYSVVDMELRGGLGDVIEGQRNIHLVTYNEADPEEVKYRCSEKISAVIGADCNSVWVITHFVDTFYAFKIDEDGVNENPVVSQVAPIVPVSGYRRAAIGYLKASPDGTKLLSATSTTNFNQVGTTDAGNGHVYLYDFDNATGEVSNPTALITNVRAYGVEFSPDSKKAFASYTQNNQTFLRQWDLNSPSIATTFYSVPNVNLLSATGLQLGPDGRIYISAINTTRLNVINNPNEFGAAINYSSNPFLGAIDLQGRTATFGLPPFIQSIFDSRIDIIDSENTTNQTQIETELELCYGDTYNLGTNFGEEATFKWYLNGELLENETSAFIEITANDDNLGAELNYSLEIFPETGVCKITGIANIRINEPPIYQDAILRSCSIAENPSGIFNLSESIPQIISNQDEITEGDIEVTFYTNETDASNQINPIENITEYITNAPLEEVYASVRDDVYGCTVISKVELRTGEATEYYTQLLACDFTEDGISFFNLLDTILPHDETSVDDILFYRSITEALSENNPILSPENYINQNPYTDEVYFRLLDNENCGTLGIVQLAVNRLPLVSKEQRFFYCTDIFPTTTPIYSSLSNFSDQYDFLWLGSNATGPEIFVNEGGYYAVLITNRSTGCENIEEIFVDTSNRASYTVYVEEGGEDLNRLFIQLNPSSIGDYQYALDSPSGPYQDAPVFDNLTPGDYRIFVNDKRGCGITTSEVSILGAMKFFTPNGDGKNDMWRIKGTANSVNKNAVVHVFDRYGKMLVRFDASSEGWDGTYNGRPMPENDYWYQIVLRNGKVIKGNFSLIRRSR